MSDRRITIDGVELTEAQVRQAWETLNKKPTAEDLHGMVAFGDGYLILDVEVLDEVLQRVKHYGDDIVAMYRNGSLYSYDSTLVRLDDVARRPFTIEVPPRG
jgi:hypothetical protein